ncbi:LysR family transcriptional regulator [Bosea sp. BK604]|uniref:LysR family transcriptional regulator n=1 Tax=Bosea sp. BK604 TaxID=2512180 RepID=UPI0010474776|nr:LysR family transcriptional regulator [Bosea sp. BK604]TCR63183.1 LysR family transcriptional regulator [Bosea sp. BK604]
MAAIHNVTLSQIRAFERTVRLHGVHAAARHLGLTQPAVSRRIRELELALGIKVFVRSGRSLRISPEGAALLGYADELINTADEMAVRLSTGDPLSGTLRLGVSASFAVVGLDIMLERLNKRHAGLKTAVHVGDSNTISELLNEQKLDLAVTSEYRIAEHIHRERTGVNLHGWFASSSQEFDEEILSPADLAPHHLIITPPPARHNASVMQWFRQANITPQRLSTCNELATTVRMILRGVGIGSVPIRVMKPYVEQGLAKELKACPPIPPYDVWICYQVEELGPSLRQVVDLIQEVVAEENIYT